VRRKTVLPEIRKTWRLSERRDHVFTDEIGRALRPNALTHAFRYIFAKLEEQGLPHRRLHDLRHTAGTLMLASGIDLNTV
jgi:integrase